MENVLKSKINREKCFHVEEVCSNGKERAVEYRDLAAN